MDAQIAPMVGRKLKSAAEEEAAATGRTALALIEAGWTADRVAAELVRRSMSAAEIFKSEQPRQQQAAGLKRKRTPAEQTQARKMRRKRQSERRKEKKRVEEEERDEEERWNEMSWTFVEDKAIRKAVAWRERRELLRAWRGVRGCAREVERMERETKVGEEEAKGPTEEPTTKSEEPVEHGGWGERLVWSDELKQNEAESKEPSDDELGWEEVTAAIAMMQKSAAVVARNRATVEQNPLFTAAEDKRTGAGPVVTSVEPTGAAGEVQGGTVAEKVVKVADAEIARSDKTQTMEQIGDNRTDWRLIQLGGVSGIA